MNALRKHFNTHNKTYSFLSILLISGFFCGFLLTRWLNDIEIANLSQYLTTVPMTDNNIKTFFSSQIVINSIFIIAIYLLGYSLIAIPLIAFIIFSRGVQIGFSCALFWHAFQFKGIVGIILTLFPQVLFDVAAFIVICRSAIELSGTILYCTFNTKAMPFLSVLNTTLTDLIIALLLTLVATFMKSTIIIYFMKIFSMI